MYFCEFAHYMLFFDKVRAQKAPPMLYIVVPMSVSTKQQCHYTKILFPPYHPFLLISFTLITVARKLSLNIFLHLSLSNLFRFIPGLSWNR